MILYTVQYCNKNNNKYYLYLLLPIVTDEKHGKTLDSVKPLEVF